MSLWVSKKYHLHVHTSWRKQSLAFAPPKSKKLSRRRNYYSTYWLRKAAAAIAHRSEGSCICATGLGSCSTRGGSELALAQPWVHRCNGTGKKTQDFFAHTGCLFVDLDGHFLSINKLWSTTFFKLSDSTTLLIYQNIIDCLSVSISILNGVQISSVLKR